MATIKELAAGALAVKLRHMLQGARKGDKRRKAACCGWGCVALVIVGGVGILTIFSAASNADIKPAPPVANSTPTAESPITAKAPADFRIAAMEDEMRSAAKALDAKRMRALYDKAVADNNTTVVAMVDGGTWKAWLAQKEAEEKALLEQKFNFAAGQLQNYTNRGLLVHTNVESAIVQVDGAHWAQLTRADREDVVNAATAFLTRAKGDRKVEIYDTDSREELASWDPNWGISIK